MKTRKLTVMALLLACALALFVAEAHIPPPVPIAGVKLGLANIVTLAALVWFGRREAMELLLCRIVLASLFAGQAVSFIYSLSGGIVCFAVMAAALPLLGRERLWVVSVLGAIGHNIGQIAAAAALIRSWQVLAYLPVLLISGILTGAFTGFCATLVTRRLKFK